MLLCLTANHRNASFDLLEKLSFGAQSAAATLVETTDFVTGAVVLATCNRFEAYLEIDQPLTAATAVAVSATIAAMSDASGADAESLRDSVTVISGDAVVEHLFAVSAGLESAVVGEDEISGQVRRALEQARTAGTTSSGLELLFQRASTTSRTVKATTAVGTAGRSLVRLSLELASSRVTDWALARVLVIGTGLYAGATLAALRDRGALDITSFSPSGRAEKFATNHSVPFSIDLLASIRASDVIITCTTVETPVLTPALFVRSTVDARPSVGIPAVGIPAIDIPALDAAVNTDGNDFGRKIVIDLGLPRNVDPIVGTIDGIELLDLETISLHAPLDELNATSDARTMVGAAAAKFTAAEAEQRLAPAIVALRSHVFDVLDAEIARARVRGDSSAQTEAALRHLAGVLLHTPSVRARELAREGSGQSFIDGLDAIFGVRPAAIVTPVIRPIGTVDDLPELGRRAI